LKYLYKARISKFQEGLKSLRTFRFRKAFIPLIVSGKKKFTSRRRRYEGLYEIVVGSRYKPKRTGYCIRLQPLARLTKEEIAEKYYREEGFESVEECLKVLNELHANSSTLWLHSIEYVLRI